MAAPAPPDPTIDLHWGEFRGAIHDIFAANAKKHPDRECVVETKSSQSNERSFTYRQINAAANRLAHHLLAHGCQIGDVAMIYAYRGVDLVVAYMGALKAGATVSVIDPQYPAERQKVLLDIARPRFLVCIDKANRESGPLSAPVLEFVATTLDLKSFIPALQLCDDGELRGGVRADAADTTDGGKDTLDPATYSSEDPSGVDVGPEAAPTLSYTSGSEGRPKGVLGRHFSLTHYFPWMAERFRLSDQDRFTMLSGIAHDPIQRDIFTPLFLGAKIIIPPVEVIAYELLAEWMKESRVTVTHLTPAMGQILVGGATARIGALRNAFFVGDQLTKKDTTKLRNLASGANVINLYGSTESQRAVSYLRIPSKNEDPDVLDRFPDIIPVGQGMQNVQLLVVDRDDPTRLCDVGEQGELFLRAGGLARGYLGSDETTQALNRAKFVANWFVDHPDPRDRLYKTGDLGRRRPDGSVECTGRIDSQVKIRGFRIELGEIDAHLSQHPFLRENVTLVRRDKNEEHTLVTYFVPETKRWFQHLEELEAQGGGGAGPTRSRTSRAALDVPSPDESIGQMLLRFRSLSEDTKKFLAGRLPSYAVPSLFIPLARMPLNPNGKIDKAALPFPDEADLAFLAKRRASSVAPKLTDTQQRLAAIWAAVIPNCFARSLRPESNFFDVGGHSILAQQMFFRLTKEWKDIDVPLRAIFQHPTLEALAAEIDRAQDPIGLRLDAVPLETDAHAQDEAYAVDARELASQLPASIPAAPATWDAAAASGRAPTVFLTGATGFLGAYIVHELIEGPTQANVIALVRATDAAAGLARLESVMTAYGLWSPAWRTASPTPRVQVVAGDFAQPQFGLTDDVWAQLSSTVDAVIHNGAQVNWMLPYSVLRAANVLSTMTCIQLCAAGGGGGGGGGKPKRLAFVSSTSALDNDHFVQQAAGPHGTPLLETDDLAGSRKGLATGYGQSKWASEYLLREAGRRGLVGAIVRSGYITGDPVTGTSVTDDFLVRLWKGCLQVGARPDIANTLNAVPVTQVNRIVVAAAFYLPAAADGVALAVAHVTGHPRPTLNDWMGALEAYGYTAPRVPYADWADRVKAYVDDEANAVNAADAGREFALLPLFHMVVGDLPGNSLAPELDDRHAQRALQLYDAASTPTANAVPLATMGVYLAYLVAAGFLPAAPAGTQATPLPQLSEAALANIAAGRLGGRSAAN
ncbi:L-aminoadipate-semialdehyde dehydrogenase [Sporothrix schenckii 1099-18]|uniref:Alpha-aminoadipate reductase n=1 Tax=Sporothrix schenckii 1099-18 TaxID=1397361 RepID=A0A0F2M1U5_SPOSC|nr:L-aminoadipate-semialdehyde dehydrogenase [Sporothrix schenckii 1099-18]KJR82106.1 L-aminoadipate-semialdehyde dehydrogenase [Sporothrix schenckii 1099-18]